MHRFIRAAFSAAFLTVLALGAVVAYAATVQENALLQVIGPYTWTYGMADYIEARVAAGIAGAGAAGPSTSLAVGGTVVNTAAVKTTPLTGATVTFASTQNLALIVPAGTIAALTLTLPACAAGNNGDERRYASSQIISALTVGAAAGSVIGASTSVAVGSGHIFHCYGADTAWYQM